MNERIRELAEQAGIAEAADVRGGYIYPAGMEKFAELIVRAVFDKIEEERFEVYQPVKESVMKHFGVEE